ncbi:MAG: Gfo/Idh/MocA family oxidoreductase [Flavobacteriales bacterium]|nr:Gfo/Idh/MocA family oxidoreductase [Flavobacteriales bacterium]
MLKIGIIGYGYWGPNLVRNFMAQPNGKVTMVADTRSERLDLVTKNYPTIKTTKNAEDLFGSEDVDAVVIATQVFSHYELALKALNSGKHVLIEKPMTSTSAECKSLIKIADEKGLKLMVDHTFLYTGAVQKLKQLIDEGSIGKIKYFDSTRINLGLFQPDINVLWDLAPHDISILNYLVDEIPYSVNATGVSHTYNEIENIAYLTVNYKSGFIAHFNCSWSSPVKIRTMLLGGDKKMMVYNDLEPTEKIKVYDTTYNHSTDEEKRKIMVEYRTGDVYIPMLDSKEALSGMAADFLKTIEQGTTPVSDNKSGLAVIKILEAAQKSIKQNGKEIILE